MMKVVGVSDGNTLPFGLAPDSSVRLWRGMVTNGNVVLLREEGQITTIVVVTDNATGHDS